MSTARTLTPDTRAVEELIVERAKLSYARLPMLEVVFDRFSLSLAQTLKSYLGAMAEVSLGGIDYLSCQDALKDQPDPSLISVTTAEEWGGSLGEVAHIDVELLACGVCLPVPRRTSTGDKELEAMGGDARVREMQLLELGQPSGVQELSDRLARAVTNRRVM